MNFVFNIITISGPAFGLPGWYFDVTWLFWTGVFMSSVNLFMNVASEVMPFPILPIIFMVIGSSLAPGWAYGAGLGLIVWTTLEAIPFHWLISRKRTD